MKRKAARRRSAWLSARVRAALSMGVVLSVASTGTFAFWTDSATVTGTTFTGGTIKLNLKDGTASNPFLDDLSGYATLNLATMVPGNSVAGVITVKNAGTAALTFVASSAATNPDTKNLAGALVVKVTADSATNSSGGPLAVTCPGAAIASSGTSLNGSLLTTPIALNTTTSTTATICVQVTLPSTANTSLQGATTDATFTFTGTQN